MPKSATENECVVGVEMEAFSSESESERERGSDSDSGRRSTRKNRKPTIEKKNEREEIAFDRIAFGRYLLGYFRLCTVLTYNFQCFVPVWLCETASDTLRQRFFPSLSLFFCF